MKKSQLEHIYDFTKTIEWLGEYPKEMSDKKITANLAANFKQQLDLYDAFFEAYLEVKDSDKFLNKDIAAEHMLDAQKRMILINKKESS